ncbi:MAG: hypothetical protein JXR68_11970 [Bacteroidales bacterium]|nr:hypothetical protein [Bacteroidales bacterium]
MYKALFFLIFVSSALLVESQNNIFSSTDDYSCKLSYSDYNNKQVIDKLAASANILGSNFNYTVNVNLTSTIDQPSGNEFVLITNYNSIALPNLTYNGFTMPNSLQPNKISFKMEFIKNGTILSEYNITDKDLNGQLSKQNYTAPVDVQTGTNNKNRYMLKVSDVKIKYSSNRVSDFNRWVKLIDDYEQANQNVISELTKLQKIPTDENVLASLPNLEEIENYQVLSQNALNLANSTKTAGFFYSLNINNNDPINLNQNIENLIQYSNSLLASTNNVLSQIDLIYLDRGNLLYKQNKINDAVYNFNKAIEHNSRLTPAHYMLALISFNSGDYEQSENILKNIFFNLGGDNQVLSDAKDLSNNLYNTYLSNADRELSGKKYVDALFWLNHAQNWCNTLNEVPCSNNLNTKFKVAYEGEMNNLLGLVDNEIKIGNLDNAQNLLKNAISYRNQFISYLQEAQPIIDRATNIYNAYINRAISSKQSNNFDGAISDFITAKEFCTNSNFIICPTDIDDKIIDARQAKYNNQITIAQNQINSNEYNTAEITLLNAEEYRSNYNLQKASNYDRLLLSAKQKQYDAAIADGRNLYNSTKYQEAILKYEFAQNIENNYNVRKNNNLTTYIKSAARQLVLQKIDAAEVKVVENNLNVARQISQDANDIAQKYDLVNEPQISTAFENINKKIFNQQCVNFNNEFTQYYNIALNKISEKKYIEAESFLQKAINLATTHVECSISMADAKNKMQEIALAVEYQKMIINANNFKDGSNFQSAIDEYIKAGEFYRNNNLDTRFSIYHTPLVDYIAAGANNFVLWGINYYAQETNLDNAFTLLKVLKSRNYNSKLTKNQQLLLGVKIAERDFSNQPTGIAKILVLQYTNGDKWFKYFAKSYKKTWKKLT